MNELGHLVLLFLDVQTILFGLLKGLFRADKEGDEQQDPYRGGDPFGAFESRDFEGASVFGNQRSHDEGAAPDEVVFVSWEIGGIGKGDMGARVAAHEDEEDVFL